jgi:hypothetical protein
MISMKVVEEVWVYICIGDAAIRATEGRLTAPLNTFGERTDESESTTRDLSPVPGPRESKTLFLEANDRPTGGLHALFRYRQTLRVTRLTRKEELLRTSASIP